MRVEGLPDRAVLFQEGLENGDDIGIVTAFEVFVFQGWYHGSVTGPRCALALELHDNADPDNRRVVSVVLGVSVVARLIASLQDRLRLMEVHDEPSGT